MRFAQPMPCEETGWAWGAGEDLSHGRGRAQRLHDPIEPRVQVAVHNVAVRCARVDDVPVAVRQQEELRTRDESDVCTQRLAAV